MATATSLVQEVANRVWLHPKFKDELSRLLRRSLQAYLRTDGLGDEIDEDALARLIQSATHLATTAESDKKEAAYRIASSAWQLFGSQYGDWLRSLLQVVFGRMGNFPAVTLLFRDIANADQGGRRLLPGEGLGDPIWLEIASREMDNEVSVTTDKIVKLTDFQRRLWDALQTGRSVTITAPTSAGKTYALQYFLGTQLAAHHDFFGLYIVPTRSLIHQVSTSLRRIVGELTERKFSIMTIPRSPIESGIQSGIYVLTQERLQILLEMSPEIRFSMVVVDEAQTVSSDSRGIILQTVVDRLRQSNPETQFLFSSPTVSNPDVFSALFGMPDSQRIDEVESPVAQNLIFINVDPAIRTLVNIEAIFLDRRQAIGSARTKIELLTPQQTLSVLSWHFGREDQNLVYVGSQAASEDVAGMISQLRQGNPVDQPEEVKRELDELSKFLREHIHRQYLLADTVLNGVGFHYGQMPSVVRQSIEDYFDEGLLRYIVSTSTLLHGINLPARNLFLLDPTKGGEWPGRDAEAISGPEFWNLAGRAGRLTREFEGNVFIINQDMWRSNPVDQDRRQPVQAALDEQLKDKRAALLEFMADAKHASGKEQGPESAFVRLFNESRRGTIDTTLGRIYGDDKTAMEEVKRAVEAAVGTVKIPAAITERHITVSVYRQQEMYDYLLNNIPKKGASVYIPPHPLSNGVTAYRSLLRLLKRIHNQFQHLPQSDKSHNYFSLIALRWMRGVPLPEIITGAFNHKKKSQKREPIIATVIRSVMTDIEKDLRFRYVKYIGCYIDILRLALADTGNDCYVGSIPNIPLFLELGASSGTMVSLISMGLSRTTAGVIAGKAVNPAMNQAEAENWLLNQNLEGLGISGICIREVEKIRSKK
jgi:hypothetical protein